MKGNSYEDWKRACEIDKINKSFRASIDGHQENQEMQKMYNENQSKITTKIN